MAETCRHCHQPIERCPIRPVPMDPAFCRGWIHTGMNDRPVGRHYCDGRSINPHAEPAISAASTQERQNDG